MGEAKRRKNIDPYFGMKPKRGRGILLSVPIVYDGRKVVAETSSIDPAELRRAALFWDRLVWPDSKIISFGSNSDEKLLETEGMLTRPRPDRYNDLAGVGNSSALFRIEDSREISIASEQAKLFASQHVEAFRDLERNEPGQWVMSEGDRSFIMKNDNFVEGRGQLITLARAIPLPDPHYPMHELLEFKHRRRDEVIGLTHELDRFFSQIANSRDADFELNRLLGVVDKQCADMIKAARESKRKFYVGDIGFSLSVDRIESAVNRTALWAALGSTATGMPLVGGALGGTLGAIASFASLSRSFGARKLETRDSPFRVVATMHEELV